HKLSPEHLTRAIGLFEEALGRAPSDPLVLSGYAIAQVRAWSMEQESPSRAFTKAREAAERAVALAPYRGEPYLALASLHNFQGEAQESARALRQALRRSPNLAEAHEAVGRILIEVGRVEEGLRHLDRALEIEPDLTWPLLEKAKVFALLGEWGRCDEIFGPV